MTLSRQERHHPTSSSSSSTSPTTTVLSDSETREREDLSGIDSHPVPVSSSHVERIERCYPLLPKPTKDPKPNKNENHDKERWDPLSSDIPEWLQEFRKSLVDDRVPEHRLTRQFFSWTILEPSPTRNADLGKHSVYTHFPKDRIARSRTSCWKFWWLDNSRSQSAQWRFSTSKQSSFCSRGARLGHPNGSSRIRAKRKPLRKHKGACKSSWSPIGSLESFTLTIPWNLAKLVKIFPGIIVRRHHTDQKQMGLLKEQCEE